MDIHLCLKKGKMEQTIFADNASTSKLDLDAYEAMKPYLLDDFGNPSSGYLFARKPRKAIDSARDTIARCINAAPEEIFFTSGGTESINWAVKGIAVQNLHRGKHIITSSIEHDAVLNSCVFLKKIGFDVTFLPVNDKGLLLIEHLKNNIKKETILVSVMMANNEIGTIQKIDELANLCKDRQAFFHCDAVQALGHIPVDVKELNVDLLSASAHKFNGPKGVGFLYIKNGTILSNLISGGKQENGYRAGTENVAGIVGMSVALKKNVDQINSHKFYLQKLKDTFLEELKRGEIDFKLNGDITNCLPGITNVSLKTVDGEAIMHRLDLIGITISTGSSCSSGSKKISHVIQAINTPPEYASGTLRISFSIDNSLNDAKIIANAIVSIVRT